MYKLCSDYFSVTLNQWDSFLFTCPVQMSCCVHELDCYYSYLHCHYFHFAHAYTSCREGKLALILWFSLLCLLWFLADPVLIKHCPSTLVSIWLNNWLTKMLLRLEWMMLIKMIPPGRWNIEWQQMTTDYCQLSNLLTTGKIRRVLAAPKELHWNCTLRISCHLMIHSSEK